MTRTSNSQIPGIRRVYIDSLETRNYWFNFARKIKTMLNNNYTKRHLINIVKIWDNMFYDLDQTFDRNTKNNNFDESNRKLEAEELMLSQITKQLDRLQEDTEQMESQERSDEADSNNKQSSSTTSSNTTSVALVLYENDDNKNEEDDNGAKKLPSSMTSKKNMNFAKKRKLAFSSLRKRSKQKRESSSSMHDTNELEEVTLNFFKFMDYIVKERLCHISTFPLYELSMLRRKGDLAKLFSAQPRKLTLAALSNPHHYMANLERDANEKHIYKEMPDISIVYSLMEERGKDINLYDWFQSFVTIVDENIDDKTYLDLTDGNSSGTSGKKKKKRIGTRKKSQDAAELLKKLTDDLDKSVKNVDLQARFVTAVSDLQYLGCIRPHHKKADHVTRLIFGM